MGRTTAPCYIFCFMLLLTSSQASTAAPENGGSVIDLQSILLDVSATLTEQNREFKYFFRKLDEREKDTTELVILQNISDTVNLIYKETKKTNESRGEPSNLETTNNDAFQRNVTNALNNIADLIKDTKTVFARDCSDIYLAGKQKSGIYRVRPTGWETIGSFDVYCDMETDEGGWTVFQRRGDFGNPEDYFYRTWLEYKEGFGNLDKEFWIGNDRLSALTRQRNYQLRVDLQDLDHNKSYAHYDLFKVENRKQLYKLTVSGYSGTAGDSFTSHNQMKFSTKDQDNDQWPNDCAVTFKGAWWYNQCHVSNLNGLNLKGPTKVFAEGMNWHSLKGHHYSMSFSEMKIKPADY